jgi:hypothetical protein
MSADRDPSASDAVNQAWLEWFATQMLAEDENPTDEVMPEVPTERVNPYAEPRREPHQEPYGARNPEPYREPHPRRDPQPYREPYREPRREPYRQPDAEIFAEPENRLDEPAEKRDAGNETWVMRNRALKRGTGKRNTKGKDGRRFFNGR